MDIELREYQIFCSKFKEQKDTTLRFGQAFYDHFKLGKITDPFYKIKIDRLYELNDDEAKQFIMSMFHFI